MTSVPVLTDYQPNYERSNLEMLQTSPSLLPPILRFSFDRQLSLITPSLFILLHPLDPLSQRFFVVPTTTPSRSLLPSLQFFQFLLLVFSFSIISIALFSFVSIASVVTTRRVVNFVHVHDRDTIRNDATIFQKIFQTIRLVLVI